MTKEETEKVCGLLFKNGHAMNARFVGRSPRQLQGRRHHNPGRHKGPDGEQEGVGEDTPVL